MPRTLWALTALLAFACDGGGEAADLIAYQCTCECAAIDPGGNAIVDEPAPRVCVDAAADDVDLEAASQQVDEYETDGYADVACTCTCDDLGESC